MSKQQSLKGYTVEELECENIELLGLSCAPYGDDRPDQTAQSDFYVALDVMTFDAMHS